MTVEFAGQAVPVTGAAKGIGRAVAEAFEAAGAQVALVDREAAAAIGPASLPILADVSRADECAAAVQATVAAFGRLDVLVNCAGIQRYGNVVETPDDLWAEVIGVNLSSMFYMAKHAVPHLRATGAGAIVNMASVQAFAAQRGVAAYAASKGGVVALTTAMAIDHAPEIRVNAVCPGSVDTPMLRRAAELFTGESGDPAQTVEGWGRMHPLGRVARASEVADAVLYLAGPRSSFISGVALRVDGGLLGIIGGT